PSALNFPAAAIRHRDSLPVRDFSHLCGIASLAFASVLALSGPVSAAAPAPLEHAKLVAFHDGMTVFLTPTGKRIEIPMIDLSGSEQEIVREFAAENRKTAVRINQAAGHEAFSGVPWADRSADEVASGFGLPMESDSVIGRSWRLYAAARKPGYRLFGAMPYSVALYSTSEGLAESLSVVYANKGDFKSEVGFGQDHFQATGEKGADSQ